MNQDVIKSYNDYKMTKPLEEEKAWTNTVSKYWARQTNTTAAWSLCEISEVILKGTNKYMSKY